MADYRKLRETLMDMAMSTSTHIPVLLEETLEALAVQPGGRYIDGTVGGGGHAAAILERSSPGGQLLGIDADPEAVKVARARLAAYHRSVLLVNENLVNLKAIGIKYDFMPVHGILFDLGLSSLQLDSRRGFSFQTDAPLDMRLSPHQEITAADIINTKSLAELERLLRAYGEEVYARRIARHIVQERPIKTTLELARVVERAVGGRKGKLHPATKTFQALRLAVNRELEHLEAALNQAIELLGFEGRLVVISYHSLEDRIVKQFMRQESTDCICPPETPTCVCGHTARLKLITRKVITPSPAEVKLNPRCRSARLRVAERIVTRGENDKITEKLYFSTGAKANGWRKPAVLKKIKAVFYAA